VTIEAEQVRDLRAQHCCAAIPLAGARGKAGLDLSCVPQLQTNTAELCKRGERVCRKASLKDRRACIAPRNFLAAAVPDIRLSLRRGSPLELRHGAHEVQRRMQGLSR